MSQYKNHCMVIALYRLIKDYVWADEYSLDDLIDAIGVDPNAILEVKDGVECTRGYYIGDFNDFLAQWDLGFITHWVQPANSHGELPIPYLDPMFHILELMRDIKGIVTGPSDKKDHAVCWDGKSFWDADNVCIGTPTNLIRPVSIAQFHRLVGIRT